MCFIFVLYCKSGILRIVKEVRIMWIDIKVYFDNNYLIIYWVVKDFGYGYIILYKLFNK